MFYIGCNVGVNSDVLTRGAMYIIAILVFICIMTSCSSVLIYSRRNECM